MIPHKTPLLALLIGTMVCPCLFGASQNINARIMANLGGISITGLPKLVFLHNSPPELARIGFACSVAHRTSVSLGGRCRTEWQITGLRTCLFIDHEQNIAWAMPNLALETLYKHLDYSDKNGRFSARIKDDCIEVHQANGQKWSYVDGYLKSIDDPALGTIEFITDREVVLRATLVNATGKPRHLLLIEYSDSGLLESITMDQRSPVMFAWSEGSELVQIRNLGSKDFKFDYKEGLVSGWQCSDGRNENYVWIEKRNAKRDSSLGRATMRLNEDSKYFYEYGRAGGLDYIVVKDRAKNFVSETRVSSKGVIQQTPSGTLKALYRINHNGIWQLVGLQNGNPGGFLVDPIP